MTTILDAKTRFKQLPGKLVIKSQATPQDVQRLVAGFGPVHVTLGKTNWFPDSGHGDVVYVEVDSSELLKLNRLLSSLDHVDTHDQFRPHVTLAYVRAGTGRRFSGDSYFEGLGFTVDSLTFSNRQGQHFDISLTGGPGSNNIAKPVSQLRPMGAPVKSKRDNNAIDESLWKECERLVGNAQVPLSLPHDVGMIGDVLVTVIDGDQAMIDYDMDFHDANNWLEAPKGMCEDHQAVIDSRVHPSDWKFNLYHELHEVRLMLGGMSYDVAHEHANAAEKKLREMYARSIGHEVRRESNGQVTKGKGGNQGTERRDKRGHRYCVEPGKGRVPCSALHIQPHQDHQDLGQNNESKPNSIGSKHGRSKPTTGRGDQREAYAGELATRSGHMGEAVTGPADAGIDGKGVDSSGSFDSLAPQDRKSLREVAKGMGWYANWFKSKGDNKAAAWMANLLRHIKEVGAEDALASLPGEAQGDIEGEIQYEGAYDKPGSTDSETRFIKNYLKKAGVVMLGPKSVLDPSKPLVSSSSGENLEQEGRQNRYDVPNRYIPADSVLNKLEEAKLLPGLESSEDLNKVVGGKVTQLTPDVVSKLDAKYGKGQWIVKPYSEEAYAGFGVFFPERVRQVQKDARQTVYNTRKALKDLGYGIARSKGNVIGISKDGQVYPFGSKEYNRIKDKRAVRLGKQLSLAASSEKGAILPASLEHDLKHGYYGISLRRNANGVPIGVTDRDGRDYNFGTPGFARIRERDGGVCGHDMDKVFEADEWQRKGYQTAPKYMVQPAFKAVGVSEAERAEGNTWETGTEGRVHVVVRNGRAQVIPYATMVSRYDYLPVVFKDKNVLAMEKAAQEAIDQLPESERQGQLYAPDVMKTQDGWKVVERNPSAAGGGSQWLGENPFVIDSMVSHMVGRDPMHVQFIRNLLKSNKVKSPSNGENEPKSLLGQVIKGFTGQREDKRGYKRCYKQGVPVPCSQLSDSDKTGANDKPNSKVNDKPIRVAARDTPEGLKKPSASEREAQDRVKPYEHGDKIKVSHEDVPESMKEGLKNVPKRELVEFHGHLQDASAKTAKLGEASGDSPEALAESMTSKAKVDPDVAHKAADEYFESGAKDNIDRLGEEEPEWDPNFLGQGKDKAKNKQEQKKKILQATFLALRSVQQYIPTFQMGQALAERVAKAKGASDKDAAKLRETLSAVDAGATTALDIVAAPSLLVPVVGEVVGAIAGASNFLPIGSMTYLTYSLYTSPIRTGLAMVEAVREVAHDAGILKGAYNEKRSYVRMYNNWKAGKSKKKPKSEIEAKSWKVRKGDQGNSRSAGEHLAEKLLEFIGSDDTRQGLFLHALDIVNGDAFDALHIAKTVVRKGWQLPPQPVDGSIAQPTQGQQGQQKPQQGQKPSQGKPSNKPPSKPKVGTQKKSLVEKAERRDKRGRKYCTEPGKGKVPCSVVNRQPQTHVLPTKTSTGKVKTVKYGNTKVQYSERRPLKPSDLGQGASLIPMPNYRQHDDHSCSFVAALSAIHSLDKSVPPELVLKSVRPTKAGGFDGKSLLDGLTKLGIDAVYRGDLTIANLRDCVAKKVPVLLTVYPPEWSSDHWTVVQGFTKDKVYLSNFRSMPIAEFKKIWFDHGEGIIVLGSKAKIGKGLNGVVEKSEERRDKRGNKYCTEPKIGRVPCTKLGDENESGQNSSGKNSTRRESSSRGEQGAGGRDESGGQKPVGASKASDEQGVEGGWKPGKFLEMVRDVPDITEESGFQDVVDKTNRKLIKIAKVGGFLISTKDLSKAVKEGEDIGGYEHEVYRDAENGRYLKLTKSDYEPFGLSSSVHEYIKRIETLNKLWPKLDYRVHGVTIDMYDEPQLVTSMKEIVGVHPNDKELKDFFVRNGWKGVIRNEWKDPVTGTIIKDARKINFIKVKSGKLVPIDINIILGQRIPKPFKSVPRSILKEGFSGKRTDRAGRTECFQNGVHVPCRPDQQSGSANKYSPKETAKRLLSFGQIHATDLKGTVNDLVKMGVNAQHAEHVAAEWFSDKIQKNVEKLSPDMQRRVKAAWFGARVITKAAFATYTASQALAEEVAKAKGATPEEAKALRAILATVDVATYKPVMIAMELTGGPGLAMSFVPLGSASYLAYSSVRNPIAVGKGMVNAVKAAAKMMGLGRKAEAKSLNELTPQQLAEAILKWVGKDDTKMGLMMHAIDVTDNAFDALKVAKAAYENMNSNERSSR